MILPPGGFLMLGLWLLTFASVKEARQKRAAQAQVVFWINGREVARGTVERTIPASFTASETFDVGLDTNSPVAKDYFDKAPFAFNGKLQRLHVRSGAWFVARVG